MLKRQRPASPLPSTSDTPVAVDSFAFDPETRHLKRPRVIPPSPDGACPSWDPYNDNHSNEDEDYIEEQGERDANGPTYADEYKQVNNVLRELHTLHQHRLLFTSPSLAQTPLESSSVQGQNTHHPSKNLTFSPSPKITPPYLDASAYSCSEDNIQKNEILQVTERYGDTNRLLGSLFLSRRQQRVLADSILPQP